MYSHKGWLGFDKLNVLLVGVKHSCTLRKLNEIEKFESSKLYCFDSSANTFCNTLCPLSKLSTRNRSSTKCALSLACPIGKLTALAPNSFSSHRTPGIDPPYTT